MFSSFNKFQPLTVEYQSHLLDNEDKVGSSLSYLAELSAAKQGILQTQHPEISKILERMLDLFCMQNIGTA